MGLSDNSQPAIPSLIPNPSKDRFEISNTNQSVSTIRVFDLVGKELLVQDVISNATVSIAHLQAGVYFVEMTDLNGSVIGVRKLVKN